MKKAMILLIIVLIAAGTYVVVAQQNEGDRMGGMMRGGMMRGGMQGRNMMMSENMGPIMHGGSMVATPDGGVIVMMGNELMKYDKDLNLTKKAEIKFDWENWQKMMSQRSEMMGQSENK